MKNKNRMIILLLAIFLLFSISSVCAGDTDNEIIGSDDATQIELSQGDENNELLNTPDTEDNQPLEQSDNEEIIGETDDGSLTALKNKIGNATENSTITLENDYEWDDNFNDSEIIIEKPMTIDGQGHKIDADDSIRIFKVVADNVVIKNITFVNGNDGAIFWNGNSGTIFNCSFIDNYAYRGGAIFWNGTDGTISNCRFVNNLADEYGGAIRWEGGNGSVSNCSFENNKITMNRPEINHNGGAIFWSGAEGTVSNSCFKNSSAVYGGAIQWSNIKGSILNCSFVDNSAKNGGAVEWYSADGIVSDCIFENNNATTGGAVHWSGARGSLSNSYFVNNTAQRGGGIYWNTENGVVSGSYFVNNSAVSGDSYIAFNGGAIYWANKNGVVSSCSFLNNHANSKGDAIYSSEYLNANYNWFGNDATNYKDAKPPVTENAVPEYILFLNATANPNIVPLLDISDIVFKLYSYNLYSGEISEYDNTLLKTINLTITPTKGTVNVSHVNPGDAIKYNATELGTGSATASIEDIQFTIKFENKLNPYLKIEPQEYTYSENTIITISYVQGASGKVNVILKGKKHNEKFTNLDLNTAIPLGAINADEYNITIEYLGDESYAPYKANSTLIINKANSTLTVENMTFDYGSKGSTTASFINASSVVAEVIDQKDAIVIVNGNEITVSNLNFGNYTLSVTTVTDENHNNITKTAKISVNKINSTITIPVIIVNYGESKNVTVATTGAINITAEIDGQSLPVDGFTIIISGLNLRNYTMTVTTTPDGNHYSVNKTAKVTVVKPDSTLDIDNIVMNYGDFLNITVNTTGAIGITAKINNTNVTVDGFTIPISGLNATYYPLTVTTITDETHNPTSKTVTILVNKINSVIEVNDTIMNYGDSANITVNTTGAIGITAKIDDEIVNVTDNVIPVSGLNAGTHLLTISTITDANHKAVSTIATITVNGLKTEITANEITTTYNIDKDLIITLKDSKGNPLNDFDITVDLNGFKTYKTDINGQVKISTKGLIPKTYAAKIMFNGNNNYLSSAKEVKVTVKKATPKLTAKAKKFKVKTKTKKYAITLKNNIGKAIKKTKVTLKVNGKTYKAKTNSKGKATFKIKNLKKKGKFTAKVKFAGNKYYKSVSKKVKITVK